MKRLLLEAILENSGSPPARGRGLKRLVALHVRCHCLVAPRAGARIETISWRRAFAAISTVAPRAGARIETCTRFPHPCGW